MNNTIAMKRFEIVVDEEKLNELVALLGEAGVRGYTCCHAADLSNHNPQLHERIDYVWTRGLGDAHGPHALVAAAWLAAAKAARKNIPKPRYRPAIYQLASA